MIGSLTKQIFYLLGFIVFIFFIGIMVTWIYNFIAISDSKLYDDNNKYINVSLGDVDGNLKGGYLLKQKADNFVLTMVSFFNKFSTAFVVIFIGVFLYMLYIHKDGVLHNISRLLKR